MHRLTTRSRFLRRGAWLVTTALGVSLLAACADDAPVAPRDISGAAPALGLNGRGDGKPALGKIAFAEGVAESDQSIFIMNGDGSGVERITDGSEDHSPAWSPDYRALVFVRSIVNQYPVIMKYTLGPGRLESLLTLEGVVKNLSWSPDGANIAFDMWKAGNSDVYVMNADGTNLRRLTTDPVEEVHPSWSPDGQRIAYERGSFGQREIHVMNNDGTGSAQVTACFATFEAECRAPAWSPVTGDERIVFDVARPGFHQIHFIHADGTNRTTVLQNTSIAESRPSWSRDGTRIAFASGMHGGAADIFSIKPNGSGLSQLTATEAMDRDPAWSR